jgi:hypothetical protein
VTPLPAERLVFDPVDHKYTVNGVEYPSVTTILKAAGVYSEYADVDPDIIARAGVRGDIVHAAIENYLKYGTWADGFLEDEDIGGYITAFDAWYRWSDFELQAAEHRTFSRTHGVAGTIDIVGSLDGTPSIIDIKTTRYLNKVAAGYQTAAYRLMWNEHNPTRLVTHRYALHLRKDGTPRLEPLTDPLDELRFIGMAMKHGRTNE